MKALIKITLVLGLIFGTSFINSLTAENDPAEYKTKAVCSLNGQITDASTGETLAGVTLKIKELNLTIYTDLDGQFVVKDVPEGTYTISADLISYKAVDVPAKATAVQANNKLVIKLDR